MPDQNQRAARNVNDTPGMAFSPIPYILAASREAKRRREPCRLIGGRWAVLILGKPRRLRYCAGGHVFHMLNRAVGRQRLLAKEADYLAFENVIREALDLESSLRPRGRHRKPSAA